MSNHNASVNYVSFAQALNSSKKSGLLEGFTKNPLPILIPAYQRGYQWNIQDCMTLVGSVFDVAFKNLESYKV